MPAVIIPFPIKSSLPRAAIETSVERLIDLLDAADAPTEDCEPDTDEESDDGEAETWPEWARAPQDKITRLMANGQYAAGCRSPFGATMQARASWPRSRPSQFEPELILTLSG